MTDPLVFLENAHGTSDDRVRVPEERLLLAVHISDPEDPEYCLTCTELDLRLGSFYAERFPCRTVRLLAKAWGWKERGRG